MSLGTFFARELAPTHRRFVETTRTALKATLTTGIAATLQIVGPFGSLFAFRIGQPGISLGLFEGDLIIVCAAAMQAAIVPVTGKLLDYPGLVLAFLFLVFATIGYFLSNTHFFLILALVAIGTITTVYVGIFEPGMIGWGSTYTFDGILAATLVMVAVDAWIWPSPPLTRLLESIAQDLQRTRNRLRDIGQSYLVPSAPLPPIKVASRLAPHLATLKSIQGEALAPSRRAAMVDAIVTSERLYLEVERLAVQVEENRRDQINAEDRARIENVLAILDTGFTIRVEKTLRAASWESSGEPDAEITTAEASRDLRTRISPLIATMAKTQSVELSRFVSSLETIAALFLERPPGTSDIDIADPVDSESRSSIDWARMRFSAKLGVAIVLGLLVGLATERADLQTILWSIAVAGQPNQYGAILRKTMLRLGGCVAGGAATLGAMILISKNFDSLLPYMAIIFAVVALSTYVAQSSEWLGYAGIQCGITFLICYVGMGPSSDVYKPLWRFWGIVLGVMTTGFVFLVLWPEFAADKVIESLVKLARTALSFCQQVTAGTVAQQDIGLVERRMSENLLEVLNFADQAKLEGRRGVENSTAANEAASMLTRIAYRFQVIARGRLAASQAPPLSVMERRASLETSYCLTLASMLRRFEQEHTASESAISTLAMIDPAMPLALTSLQEAALSTEDFAVSVDEIESYRRIPLLLEKLDDALSRIEN